MRLVDTTVFVDHLRGLPAAVVFFEGLRGGNGVAFSSICETEMLAGRANAVPSVRSALLRFLQRWKKLDVSNPIALRAGDLVRTHGLSVPDAIIAATAIHHKAGLVTRNTKDFRRVKGLRTRVPY